MKQSRTIVISGGSSGIGSAMAERFMASGDRVVVFDVMIPGDNLSSNVDWKRVDIRDWMAVDSAIEEVASSYGSLDVVIANAGMSVRTPFLDLSKAQIWDIIDINFLGVVGLWQAATRLMLRQGHGVLIGTTSTNASRGYPLYSDYNASKAAVLAVMKTIALEFAPIIRCVCISPGYVTTPMQEAEYTEEMMRDLNSRIPAGRHARPKEIAEAAFYLASDLAGFVTGQELVIDGGELAGGTASVYGIGNCKED